MRRHLLKELTTVATICLSLALTSKLCADGLPPAERAEIQLKLREPIKIHLSNGRTLPGHSIEVLNNTLQIATAEGAGEAVYSFQAEQIERFEIPGEAYKTTALHWLESGELESALELMEMLYRQRINLIPFLPESEANFFCLYAEARLQSKQLESAVAIAEILSPHTQKEQALDLLERIRMQGYQMLNMHRRAVPIAEEWVDRHSKHTASALAYYILAEDALRADQPERAIDLALQPIVFPNPVSSDKLAECYAVAIAAAIALRDKDYAVLLYQEMQERELLWPIDNRTLQPFYEKLLQQLENS